MVDLSLSDDIVNLYLDRTDIAVRVGSLTDSSLFARKIGTAYRMIVGAPAYLEEQGTPQTIADLDHHNCLGFNFRRTEPVWPLRDGGRIVDRMVGGCLLANNGETVRRMVLAAAGLGHLADYHVRTDIEAGRLTEILADAGHGDAEDVHAIYPGSSRMPYRVRIFLDFMVPRLQAFMRGDAST